MSQKPIFINWKNQLRRIIKSIKRFFNIENSCVIHFKVMKIEKCPLGNANFSFEQFSKRLIQRNSEFNSGSVLIFRRVELQDTRVEVREQNISKSSSV